MKLNDDVETVEGLPIIYIKSLSALVCSDLHLGYEGVSTDRGFFLPKINLKRIKEMLSQAVSIYKPGMLIVNGDIKNEFSKVHIEEFNELMDFVKFVKGPLAIKQLVLIKGNHDNFVDRLEKPFGIKIYRQETLLNGYLFFHGEEEPHEKSERMMIMGHVHPSISIFNDLGVKERFRCFLFGKSQKGIPLLVLPAMNYFGEGTEVNLEDVSRLAPVFKKDADMEAMHALCINDEQTLDFGSIGKLRKLAKA